jgi:hypothetical protein
VTNPYAAPQTSAQPSRPPRRAIFEVGTDERHVVEVFLGMSGLEVYVVDGIEVLRVWSYSIRATRRFEVGNAERHTVEVRLDSMPNWKSLLSPREWIAEAYVDGKLVVPDLVPDLRRWFADWMRVFNVLIVVLFVMLVLLLQVLVLLFLVITYL